MPQQGVKRMVATSRITQFFCNHPRLTLFVLLTVVMIAMSGSAVAEDTSLGSDDFSATDNGPSDGSDS